MALKWVAAECIHVKKTVYKLFIENCTLTLAQCPPAKWSVLQKATGGDSDNAKQRTLVMAYVQHWSTIG